MIADCAAKRVQREGYPIRRRARALVERLEKTPPMGTWCIPHRRARRDPQNVVSWGCVAQKGSRRVRITDRPDREGRANDFQGGWRDGRRSADPEDPAWRWMKLWDSAPKTRRELR